jgi:penicillin-binding protein 1A
MVDRRRVLQIARRVALYAGVIVVALGLAAALTLVLVVARYESRLPSVEELKKGYDPPQVTRVLSRDGTLLGSVFTERRTVVPFSSVPGHVKLAFLAAEDASFYEHQGLDYFGMLRALLANLRAGGTRQGASTITQQVVKNLFLSPERTYERKIKETILARRLEKQLSKDEIFSLYLNHIYLGHGRYGVQEAARHYFGRPAASIDLAEAALLAGIVAAPERFSPREDADKALSRRRYVLDQMLAKGFVTRPLYDEAVEAPLRLAPSSEEESALAPEVVAHARKLLEQVAGPRAARGGYTITTTLDLKLQALARKAVRDGLSSYAERQKLLPPLTLETRKLWGPAAEGTPKPNKIYVGKVVALDDAKGSIDVQVGDTLGRVQLANEERYDPKHLPPSGFTRVGAALRVALGASRGGARELSPLRLELGPQGALVAIDPRSREVRALVGSHEAIPGGLDRALRAHRQPGSAFKPFVYGYALASRRFTAASVLELGARPGTAEPVRRVPLRTAISKSDNQAAEQLLSAVGAPNVIEWARALGIESPLAPTPSLALGAYEVVPLELANAYASFASGGEVESARLVTRIVGPDGKELSLPPEPPKRRVLSAEEAYLVTSLLRSVVESGTGKRAASLGRPVVGKTGTTNAAKDAWFAGYSTELVAVVWIGYDDALPLGPGESGAQTALPAWIQFMKGAHEGRPVSDFPRPSAIVRARIDPASGLLAYEGQLDAIDEEFLDGTVPSEIALPAPATPEPSAVDDESRAGGTTEAGRVTPPTTPSVPAVPRSQGGRPGLEAGAPELPPF